MSSENIIDMTSTKQEEDDLPYVIKNDPRTELIKILPRCFICLGPVILPVKLDCKFKGGGVFSCNHDTLTCLKCIRLGLQLDEKSCNRRDNRFNYPCGCWIIPKESNISYFKHCRMLYQTIDYFIKPKCQNGCGKIFDSQSDYLKHLRSPIREGGCPEGMTKCIKCSFYDKRRVVEGEHALEHFVLKCGTCKFTTKNFDEFKEHMDEHLS